MIRMLEEKDIPACLEIYNHYILHSNATFETEPLNLMQFSRRVSDITAKYPWIVLEEEGRVRGYAYLSPFIDRAAYDWTADAAVYLDPACRRQGFGSLLMENLIRLAKRDGYCQMVSVITDGNTGSEKLHEKLGFRKTAYFAKIGYKGGRWLGVNYYVLQLREDIGEESLPVPVNLTL